MKPALPGCWVVFEKIMIHDHIQILEISSFLLLKSFCKPSLSFMQGQKGSAFLSFQQATQALKDARVSKSQSHSISMESFF